MVVTYGVTLSVVVVGGVGMVKGHHEKKHYWDTVELPNKVSLEIKLALVLSIWNRVEPLNKAAFGNSHFILCREVVLFQR